jgi:hypothetical protein
MERCIEKNSKRQRAIRKEKYGNPLTHMRKSRKKQAGNNRKSSYYDDYESDHKKLKKSKYNDSRTDKAVEKQMFIDFPPK